MKKILLVEDESLVALDIRAILQNAGYEVVGVARCVSETLTLMRTTRPDILLMDFALDDWGDGIYISGCSEHDCNLPLGLLSGYLDKEKMRRTVEASPEGMLRKPVDEGELLDMVARVANRMELS